MSTESILLLVISLVTAALVLVLLLRKQQSGNNPEDLNLLKEQIKNYSETQERYSRELKTELIAQVKDNREELNKTISDFRGEQKISIQYLTEKNNEALLKLTEVMDQKISALTEKNEKQLEKINQKLEEKINGLIEKTTSENKESREGLVKALKEFSESTVLQLDKINNAVKENLRLLAEQSKSDSNQMREALAKSFREFQDAFDKNVKSFNDLQREKFGQLETKQGELIRSTEEKLEKMRETVDEKLTKTLNERLGQSFETVGKQLMAVQEGLGEMKNLAQDVGGLKNVLSNVKKRGGIGELQLEMLLEQILAEEQFVRNAKTKKGSDASVEFAIKLPGKDDNNMPVLLPVDSKFPKEIYEKVLKAYDGGNAEEIDAAHKELENGIKKMAKDIRDKYIDPPNTTDFGVMFLPFEGLYAEVVRNSDLLERLQREFKVVVTGPTTLAAILNSLQMGFRTLALQKRSSEVWTILGAVKSEFDKFGGLLEKAHKNINTAGNTIEELMGKRTNVIKKKLRDVQALPSAESEKLLPGIGEMSDDDEGED